MTIDILGFFILLITGFVAGTLGGLLGIGGCVVIMPVIRFGFHFSPTLMVGTSLAAVVFTSASGAWNNWRIRNIDNSTTLTFAISGVIGIIVGSIVFSYIAQYGSIIDLLIGLAFLWPALRMLNEGIFPRRFKEIPGSEIPGSKTAKSVIGSSVGFLTGVTGLCGGYALVPLSVYVLKSNMKIYLEALFAEIKYKPQQFFVGLCVFFVAIMGTSVHHVASTAFALLFVAGMFILKDWVTAWKALTKYEKWLLIGFSLYALSAVISYVNVQDTSEYIKELERYFRFLLAVPIYLFIKKYNIDVINYLFYGAIVSGPFLFSIALSDYINNPDVPAKGYYHHIIFGSVAMLNVGVMLAILLVSKINKYIKVIVVVSMLCGVVAAVLSQSRGVWLVLPVYFLIALYYTLRHSKGLFGGLIVVSVLVVAILLASPVGEMVMKKVA